MLSASWMCSQHFAKEKNTNSFAPNKKTPFVQSCAQLFTIYKCKCWNWTYNTNIIVNHSCTSRRCCLSGQMFSSTSQQISSLTMQWGNDLLEWWIHLDRTCWMSSHAAPWLLAGPFGSLTFHLQEEKKILYWIQKWWVGREILSWSKHTLFHTTTYWFRWSPVRPCHSQGLCSCEECLKRQQMLCVDWTSER